MSTKDELETKLYEKMSQENEAFLAEMKTQSPDEIISHAYEIACRDNLLMLFEDETSLSERQLAVLTEFEHPLSQLYTDWLSHDTDEMDAFRDSIACCADDILRKRVEETCMVLTTCTSSKDCALINFALTANTRVAYLEKPEDTANNWIGNMQSQFSRQINFRLFIP